VVEEAVVPELDPEVVRRALLTFEGPIEQVPPMVSALKHEGRRLYELARAGLDVERAPRRVMVYEIVLRELGAGHADIHIRCGRGCYVRSIAHDLGRLLAVPAHLEALRRSAVGPFRVADALQLDALEALPRGDRAGEPAPPGVLSLPQALQPFPELVVRAGFERAVLHGAQPELRFFVDVPRDSGPCRLVSEDGRRLLAVGATEGRMQFARVQLLRVFPEPIPIGEGDDAA
jgi:tRNA pseudouridine55 synthase